MGSPRLSFTRNEKPRRAKSLAGLRKSGARDRARTGDVHVGKEYRGLATQRKRRRIRAADFGEVLGGACWSKAATERPHH